MNMIKHGREITLKISDLFRTSYGTVDISSLKSIFLTLSTWVEPIEDMDDWYKIIKSFKNKIKKTINCELELTPFKDIIIVDLDLRASGVKKGKRSFMKCEITFFLDEIKGPDIKSKEIVAPINKITNKIITDSFLKSNTFVFHKSKK